jgi:hypothetical protein
VRERQHGLRVTGAARDGGRVNKRFTKQIKTQSHTNSTQRHNKQAHKHTTALKRYKVTPPGHRRPAAAAAARRSPPRPLPYGTFLDKSARNPLLSSRPLAPHLLADPPLFPLPDGPPPSRHVSFSFMSRTTRSCTMRQLQRQQHRTKSRARHAPGWQAEQRRRATCLQLLAGDLVEGEALVLEACHTSHVTRHTSSLAHLKLVQALLDI